jgi:hypothetical protein
VAPGNAGDSVSALDARIRSALGGIRPGSLDANRRFMEELLRELMAADPAEAIRAITAFLKGGDDVATGLEFAVGSGGKLKSWPSLRVLLLDVLGRISPEAALPVSREVLGRKDSADEWALAMRNIAWGDRNSNAYLEGKVREMWYHNPWLAEPSGGFLEAFDVAVYVRGAGLVPRLEELMRSPRVELERAAIVALDRIADAAPLDVMSMLNSNPGLISERPLVRADYFSKADLRDSRQRQAVEVYLGRTDVAPEEKQKFVDGLAAPGQMVGDSLLAPPPDPDRDLAARDRAMKDAVSGWMASGKYPELEPGFRRLLALPDP